MHPLRRSASLIPNSTLQIPPPIHLPSCVSSASPPSLRSAPPPWAKASPISQSVLCVSMPRAFTNVSTLNKNDSKPASPAVSAPAAPQTLRASAATQPSSTKCRAASSRPVLRRTLRVCLPTSITCQGVPWLIPRQSPRSSPRRCASLQTLSLTRRRFALPRLRPP